MDTVKERFQPVLNEISQISYEIYTVVGKNLDIGHITNHLVPDYSRCDYTHIAMDSDEDIEYHYSIRSYGGRSVFMICERRYEFEYSNITRIYNLFHCISNHKTNLFNTQHMITKSDYPLRGVWRRYGSYCHYDTAGSPLGTNVHHHTYIYNYSAYDKSEKVIAGPKNSQFHTYPQGEYIDGIGALTMRNYPE
ncbi:hypothetical protein PV-S19_0373 [Pacmanvirus S19]|nr:hypothetical protein PV-S19_0373 [Pacmanvirus S19]